MAVRVCSDAALAPLTPTHSLLEADPRIGVSGVHSSAYFPGRSTTLLESVCLPAPLHSQMGLTQLLNSPVLNLRYRNSAELVCRAGETEIFSQGATFVLGAEAAPAL